MSGDIRNVFFTEKVYFYDEKNFDKLVHDDFNAASGDNVPNDPCFISNVGSFINNINVWRNKYGNVDLCYKLNANPDEMLVSIMREYNVLFNVVSGQEMEELINSGVSADNILFNGACKTNRNIRTASLHQINNLNFGTAYELRRIAEIFPSCKLTMKIQVDNINIDNILGTCAQNISHVSELLDLAKELSLNICGIQLETNDNIHLDYSHVFSYLEVVLDKALEYGYEITMLNIGSGDILFKDNEFEVDCCCCTFDTKLDEFMAKHRNIRLFAEPGAQFMNSSVQLCCSVVGLKHVKIGDDTDEIFYYLNDGLYGSLSNILYRDYKCVPLVLKKDPFQENETYKASIWGPTCDSMDKICTLDNFPLLKIGDVLSFQNVGSYSRCCASTFNGFEISKIFYIISYQKLEALGIPREEAEHFMTQRHALKV